MEIYSIMVWQLRGTGDYSAHSTVTATRSFMSIHPPPAFREALAVPHAVTVFDISHILLVLFDGHTHLRSKS